MLGNTGDLAINGCSFSGWNTKADGSGTLYSSGDSISVADGSSDIVLYAQWTTSTVEDPTSNIASGAYDLPLSVVLSCLTAGSTIYYTTDGSTPSDTNGTEYTAAISVTAATTIKAIAYNGSMLPSAVVSYEYTIKSYAVSAVASCSGATIAGTTVTYGSYSVGTTGGTVSGSANVVSGGSVILTANA